jgi:hypothetical protein
MTWRLQWKHRCPRQALPAPTPKLPNYNIVLNSLKKKYKKNSKLKPKAKWPMMPVGELNRALPKLASIGPIIYNSQQHNPVTEELQYRKELRTWRS